MNNSGGSKIARGTPFFDLALEDWQRQIGLNLNRTFYCARAAARNMIERQQGTLINMASVFSFATGTGNAAYTAAKGGIVQLTKAIAIDLAPYRVGVNAVAPGPSVFEKDYSIRDSVMGTRGKHVNVLQHLMGYLKNQLSSEDKQELLGLIEDCRQGLA